VAEMRTGWPNSSEYTGVVRGAEHGDEDLRRPFFSRRGVDDGDRLPGVIDEELLAGPVLLAHDEVEAALPGAVALAEAAILVAVGVKRLVLLPQQHERHA